MELFFSALDKSQILVDEPMKNHTSFKIGGSVDTLLLPKSIDEIKKCVKICTENNLQYLIIGNGSNLLVSDKGFRGVIIKLSSNFSNIIVEKNIITANCGSGLSHISKIAFENSLKGFEFASGIPGTLGGAICMNAGAHGFEMKDFVKEVVILDSMNLRTLTNKQCDFKYRNSEILNKKMIVLQIVIELSYGNKEEILKNMKALNKIRNDKQPITKPSAGSIFKRPLNNFAGKLIMDAGLAGKTIGGATISSKHCGFIINSGGATCEDVLSLISFAKKEVFKQFGVKLEREVRIIGEFKE